MNKHRTTCQLEADEFDKLPERDFGVLAVQVEGQLGDDLGVGVGFELESLALKELAQVLEVGDDP